VSDNVHPLKRPPIRQSTLVRNDRAHTFEVFVRDIGAWWPARPHSLGQDRVGAAIADVPFDRWERQERSLLAFPQVA
jgi:hypothetical protein